LLQYRPVAAQRSGAPAARVTGEGPGKRDPARALSPRPAPSRLPAKPPGARSLPSCSSKRAVTMTPLYRHCVAGTARAHLRGTLAQAPSSRNVPSGPRRRRGRERFAVSAATHSRPYSVKRTLAEASTPPGATVTTLCSIRFPVFETISTRISQGPAGTPNATNRPVFMLKCKGIAALPTTASPETPEPGGGRSPISPFNTPVADESASRVKSSRITPDGLLLIVSSLA
jgi:hypothetical protein